MSVYWDELQQIVTCIKFISGLNNDVGRTYGEGFKTADNTGGVEIGISSMIGAFLGASRSVLTLYRREDAGYLQCDPIRFVGLKYVVARMMNLSDQVRDCAPS